MVRFNDLPNQNSDVPFLWHKLAECAQLSHPNNLAQITAHIVYDTCDHNDIILYVI